ncbi:MAG: selenide, water dikinase SelD [Acidobacteria bacterium]|nr:selenide, water dikinase SelD [Acidobacteriota bacterium]
MKFGYAVTGAIDPGRILTNAGALCGDALVLTKRIGTGVITTALKRGIARQQDVDGAVDSMLALNRAACEVMLKYPVHGCTDITGFGLLGHAREMAQGSGLTLDIDHAQIEFLPGALDYSRQGAIPAGLKNNREFVSCAVRFGTAIAEEVENLLYDPQTSGGLLISVSRESAATLAEELEAAGVVARVVGEVRARDAWAIVVR